jgi:hypothetical protein
MKLLSLILFTTCFQAFSAKVEKFDLNKDKKIDRIKTFNEDKLIKIEEDRNFDGNIDFTTEFTVKGFSSVEKQDSNFDGRIDRVKKIQIPINKKVKIFTQVDKDFDGKFEIQYTSTIDSDQKKDNHSCSFKAQSLNQLNALADLSLMAAADPDGFIATDFGYKIDASCVDKWSNDFIKNMKESITTGMSCLDKLSKVKTVNLSGAQKNSSDLQALLDSKSIKILCSEESDYEWEGTAGHASTDSSSEAIASPKASHPFISLNPFDPENKENITAEEISELKKTVFHEQLHNLGHRHSHSIEYPYACEDCCFDGNDPGSISCKICIGDYKSEVDLSYMKDLATYSKENSSVNAKGALFNYFKENPKDITGLSLLANMQNDIFNPMGPALAKVIQDRMITLDPQDSIYISQASEWSGIDLFNPSKVTASTIANATVDLYYEKDASKAIALLEKSKDIIIKEFSDLDAKGVTEPDYLYIKYELKQSLDSLIYEMWINDYPDDKNSDKAYELFLVFDAL